MGLLPKLNGCVLSSFRLADCELATHFLFFSNVGETSGPACASSQRATAHGDRASTFQSCDDRADYQVVVDTHEVVLTEGAPAETFLVRGSNYELFSNFAQFKRHYRNQPLPNMSPFAPIVGYEGGRENLKALLRLGASPFVQTHDPIQEIYERLADRPAQFAQ